MFIKEIISKLVNNQDLSLEESLDVMMQIMEGKATDAQIASLRPGFLQGSSLGYLLT